MRFRTRLIALVVLVLAPVLSAASDRPDFASLSERGELRAAPELAYAHWLGSIRMREHTVFCHVGELPCGDAGEPGASPEQIAEVVEMIDVIASQFPRDIELVSATVRDAEATVSYSGRDAKGVAVNGVVEMERKVYGHWRIISQVWQPAR